MSGEKLLTRLALLWQSMAASTVEENNLLKWLNRQQAGGGAGSQDQGLRA